MIGKRIVKSHSGIAGSFPDQYLPDYLQPLRNSMSFFKTFDFVLQKAMMGKEVADMTGCVERVSIGNCLPQISKQFRHKDLSANLFHTGSF